MQRRKRGMLFYDNNVILFSKSQHLSLNAFIEYNFDGPMYGCPLFVTECFQLLAAAQVIIRELVLCRERVLELFRPRMKMKRIRTHYCPIEFCGNCRRVSQGSGSEVIFFW